MTSKTGGGVGTNQYAIKGRSLAANTPARAQALIDPASPVIAPADLEELNDSLCDWAETWVPTAMNGEVDDAVHAATEALSGRAPERGLVPYEPGAITTDALYQLNDHLMLWASARGIGDGDPDFHDKLDNATHAAAAIMSGVYRDKPAPPCEHLHQRFRGESWSCDDCGEPLDDSDGDETVDNTSAPGQGAYCATHQSFGCFAGGASESEDDCEAVTVEVADWVKTITLPGRRPDTAPDAAAGYNEAAGAYIGISTEDYDNHVRSGTRRSAKMPADSVRWDADATWQGIPMSFPNGTPDRYRADPADLAWMRGYVIDVTDADGVTHTIEADTVTGAGTDLSIQGWPFDPDTGQTDVTGRPVIIPLAAVNRIEVP